MGQRQDLGRVARIALDDRLVLVAARGEAVVTVPPVGEDGRTLFDVVLHEQRQHHGASICNRPQAHAAGVEVAPGPEFGAVAAALDRADDDQIGRASCRERV